MALLHMHHVFLVLLATLALTSSTTYEFKGERVLRPDGTYADEWLGRGRLTKLPMPDPSQARKAKPTFKVEKPGRIGNITLVELFNQDESGDGTSAKIVAGGPGFSNITVEFESEPGNGIHFTVEFYGNWRFL